MSINHLDAECPSCLSLAGAGHGCLHGDTKACLSPAWVRSRLRALRRWVQRHSTHGEWGGCAENNPKRRTGSEVNCCGSGVGPSSPQQAGAGRGSPQCHTCPSVPGLALPSLQGPGDRGINSTGSSAPNRGGDNVL